MDECSRVVLVGVVLLLLLLPVGSTEVVERLLFLLLFLVQSRLLLSSSLLVLLLLLLLLPVLLWQVVVMALVVLIFIFVIIIVLNFRVGVAGGDVVVGTSSAIHHAVESDVSWVSCIACRLWLASFTLLIGAPGEIEIQTISMGMDDGARGEPLCVMVDLNFRGIPKERCQILPIISVDFFSCVCVCGGTVGQKRMRKIR